MFLSKPSIGFSSFGDNLEFKDNKGNIAPSLNLILSYIDDVVNMFLDNLILSIENNIDLCITFDAEGWNWKLINDGLYTYVMVIKDDIEVYTCDLTMEELAQGIILDLEENIELWCNFYECENKEYSNDLKNNLKRLKRIVDQTAEDDFEFL